jgi:hypothetical protein
MEPSNSVAAKRRRPFRSRKKALIRVLDDTAVLCLRDLFYDKVSTTLSPGLLRIVTAECFVLELIHECFDRSRLSHGFSVAGNSPTDSASLETVIVVIHKRTRPMPW